MRNLLIGGQGLFILFIRKYRPASAVFVLVDIAQSVGGLRLTGEIALCCVLFERVRKVPDRGSHFFVVLQNLRRGEQHVRLFWGLGSISVKAEHPRQILVGLCLVAYFIVKTGEPDKQ